VSDGRIEVAIDVPAIDVRGHVVVHTARGASQVVSLPFDNKRGMCSHKGMFPVEGSISVGERRFELRDALALLDDHKGYYPYVMKWDRATAAAVVNGRALGFNLTLDRARRRRSRRSRLHADRARRRARAGDRRREPLSRAVRHVSGPVGPRRARAARDRRLARHG
jgi:hypothetical protein